ncbi:YozQ family protein [Aneurinibacillus sp. Ricciae_BoGa-3]|uniref:YozQ family protein n=1 Tax=Aneurinibacillus sp. Ricciae_BoGa-3 TaxID=3022697 RepID=UPI0023405D33|nr:YozQ family protein [Aneurinibacillus sp. Ricciae_BoGa-3]WCK56633.1 YozQ family protein [Aneurinibacillus sp. Ricciae_BoGa-3]
MKDNQFKEEIKTADRNYEVEDYKRKDQVSIGLATTHEQVSDHYMSGEYIAGNDSAEDQPAIPRKD